MIAAICRRGLLISRSVIQAWDNLERQVFLLPKKTTYAQILNRLREKHCKSCFAKF